MSIFDRTATPLEPCDLATPRLTFEEVRELVSVLHGVTLQALAMGPMSEAEGGCGLCNALHDQEAIDGSRKSEIAVGLLRAWHDNVDFGPGLLDRLYDRDGWAPQSIDDARHGVLGALAYARCTTVYALAAVELVHRWSKP